MAGTHGHGRSLPSPDNGSFLELYGEGAECAVVFCDVWIEKEGVSHRHGGLRVGVRRVDESGDLGIRACEVDCEIASLLGYTGADDDVLFVEAVIVEDGFAEVFPIRPFGDDAAGVTFGGIEHRFDRGGEGVGAELPD